MAETLSKKITKAAVDALRPGQIIRDTELVGFVVRNQNGTPVYYVNKRLRAAGPVWVRIGQHGSPWTPGTARRKAIELSSLLAQGINPNDQLRAEREKLTVAEGFMSFMAEHGPKLKSRTREEYQRLIDKTLIPAFGKRGVDELSHAAVARFHSRLAEVPAKANFALAVLSKFMGWCEEQGLRPDNSNPCRKIKKYREGRRERYLTFEEFARLGSVLDEAERDGTESVFSTAAIRLYLLTGARRNEILTLKWEHVDFDRSMLRLPDSKTGEKIIRLNTPAIEILRRVPRLADNPYVIVGDRVGAHLINIQKPWRRLRARAGLEDVRLHDLRHSFASIVASSGGSLQKLGALLGHASVQTTERYAHLFDDPVRQLNEETGAAIEQAMRPSFPPSQGS